MNKQPDYWAVIPAAGIGNRMQSGTPKQYLKLHDKCILEHTLEIFCQHPNIKGVVVALSAQDSYWPELSVSRNEKIRTTPGGDERCHSVLNGLNYLEALAQPEDWILVHDAARPCLQKADVDALIEGLKDHPVGGILALPVSDTMKRADAKETIQKTIDRSMLWHALTPQMFRLNELRHAMADALDRGLMVTDEAQAIERQGMHPKLVQGHANNIKVTVPDDLALAAFYLSQQEALL